MPGIGHGASNTRDVGSTWFGEVVNTNDPNKSGRVQVRIYGKHDGIADKDLPWVSMGQGVLSAGTKNIGGTPHGLIKGSKVSGAFVDNEQQIPLVRNSHAAAGKSSGANDWGVDRGEGKDGEHNNQTPHGSQGRDENSRLRRRGESDKGITRYARNKPQRAKYADDKSIGNLADVSGRLLQLLRVMDPGNSSGVVKNAVAAMIGVEQVNGAGSGTAVPEFGRASVYAALKKLVESEGSDAVVEYLGLMIGGITHADLLPAARFALGGSITLLAYPGGPLVPLVDTNRVGLDGVLEQDSPTEDYYVTVTLDDGTVQHGWMERGGYSDPSDGLSNSLLADQDLLESNTERVYESLRVHLLSEERLPETFASIMNAAVSGVVDDSLRKALGGQSQDSLLGIAAALTIADGISKLTETVLDTGAVQAQFKRSKEREAKAQRRQQHMDSLQDNPLGILSKVLSTMSSSGGRPVQKTVITRKDGTVVDG